MRPFEVVVAHVGDALPPLCLSFIQPKIGHGDRFLASAIFGVVPQQLTFSRTRPVSGCVKFSAPTCCGVSLRADPPAITACGPLWPSHQPQTPHIDSASCVSAIPQAA